ncbi:MAG: hypothetical protein JKY13_00735 [Gammaproteobacteria bacterium]|nr:hypothetical protein [Gammaproteobacteria bacterium]
MNEDINLQFNDQPERNSCEDKFHINERFVSKIVKLIEQSIVSNLTIAITGEWGVGKTTAINFLVKKIENAPDNNIVVRFEPLLEGKLSISGMMEFFYLKLYARCTSAKDTKLKGIIKNSVESLRAIQLTVGVPYLGSVSVDGEKLLNAWGQKDNSFSTQAKEINECITQEKLKIYVIIDEVDRLSAQKIVDFLMFARILEEFNNIVCIIGIDYEQVLNALQHNQTIGLGNYSRTKSYLDKLFQKRFHISHSSFDICKFSENKLKEIDKSHKENHLSRLFKDDDGLHYQEKLEKMLAYLSVPRQIKKWLLSIYFHYELFGNSPEKILDLLGFMAVCIKHPVVVDYIARHTLSLLNKQGINLANYINENYKQNLFVKKEIDKNTQGKLLLASAGFTDDAELNGNDNDNTKEIKKFLKKNYRYAYRQ